MYVDGPHESRTVAVQTAFKIEIYTMSKDK